METGQILIKTLLNQGSNINEGEKHFCTRIEINFFFLI